tara:strand:+ start:183 stop:473 length:291 start_codon:yes stop_codon:yes gene_type:complete
LNELETIYDDEQIAYINSFAIREGSDGGISYLEGAWPYLHVNLIYNGCEMRRGVIVKSTNGIPLDLSREEDLEIYNSIVRDTRKQCMSHPRLIIGD